MYRKLTTVGLTLSLAAVSAPALAVDLSANIGYNSQYIFRGIPQKNSSAMAGLDLEARIQTAIIRSPNQAEAVRAGLEDRQPKFVD